MAVVEEEVVICCCISLVAMRSINICLTKTHSFFEEDALARKVRAKTTIIII
jgi:hypothetical protein